MIQLEFDGEADAKGADGGREAAGERPFRAGAGVNESIQREVEEGDLVAFGQYIMATVIQCFDEQGGEVRKEVFEGEARVLVAAHQSRVIDDGLERGKICWVEQLVLVDGFEGF